MRIAFITGKFPALSETFILNQITGLIDRGHEVDVYSWNGEARVHPDVEHYKLLDRTAYWPRMPAGKVARLGKGIGLLAKNVVSTPNRTARSLNVFRYGRQAASLMLLQDLDFLRRRGQYDIVHCHFGPNGLKGAMLREIGALRGKLITTFYGFDLTASIREFGRNYYRLLFSAADLLLPLSECFRKVLLELGCPPEKIRVHHIGINTDRFAFKPRSKATDAPTRFVSVARLVEKKGIEYGIRALAQAVAQGRNVEYHIVGDGALRSDLQKLSDSLNLGSRVQLLGSMPQPQVIDVLNSSHVLLAPSVTDPNGDQEGTPTALMEAMAMGLPVVGTIHSGIPEMIDDGVSGFLVPERDVDALARKVIELADQPDRWAAMGQAGRRKVEAEFDVHKLNDALVAIYRSL